MCVYLNCSGTGKFMNLGCQSPELSRTRCWTLSKKLWGLMEGKTNDTCTISIDLYPISLNGMCFFPWKIQIFLCISTLLKATGLYMSLSVSEWWKQFMIAREEMPKKSLCRKGNYYRSEQVNIKSIRYCKCTSVLYILVKSPHIGGNLIKVSKVLKKNILSY